MINKHLVMHGKLFNGIFKPTGLTKYFWDSLKGLTGYFWDNLTEYFFGQPDYLTEYFLDSLTEYFWDSLTKYFWDSLHCVFAEHKGLAVPGHNGCAGVTLLCCVGARRLQITFLRKQPLCLQAVMCCPVPDNP